MSRKYVVLLANSEEVTTVVENMNDLVTRHLNENRLNRLVGGVSVAIMPEGRHYGELYVLAQGMLVKE